MIGKTYAGELSTYKDAETNATITKLTNTSNNFHFYFTDNSFMKDDKEILFLSDRGAKEENIFNFFKMDLASGEMTCLSNETDIIPNRYTKTPNGDVVIYVSGDEIKKLDVKNGKTTVIYKNYGTWDIGATSISCDNEYLIFLENEKSDIPANLPNYGGFMDRMFETKKCRIMLISMNGGNAEKIYEDTHYSTHIQFSPTVPYIATYCHEGPWNLVHQRIWIINLLTRTAMPCARQGASDCIGHEFWTTDGLIFFENRREGHDGTITEDKTQAYVKNEDISKDLLPYVGIADHNGNILRTIDMPVYCNHYHANKNNSLLVGDAASHIMLIDISSKEAKAKELCTHNTSWRTQTSHCHPTFGWNSNKILYTSDTGGKLNIYLTEV